MTEYNRDILVNVLVYHYRKTDSISSGCGCGWAELGKSHSEHVANMYEMAVTLKPVEEDIALHVHICEYEDDKGRCKNYAIKKINVANYETIRVCTIHHRYFMEK